MVLKCEIMQMKRRQILQVDFEYNITEFKKKIKEILLLMQMRDVHTDDDIDWLWRTIADQNS